MQFPLAQNDREIGNGSHAEFVCQEAEVTFVTRIYELIENGQNGFLAELRGHHWHVSGARSQSPRSRGKPTRNA